MPVTYASLCSGYDGIGMGLGLAPAWVSEVEASVAEVLKREYPQAPNLGDIKALGARDWVSAGPVELLSSGDPCQSISIAGRREGREDPRFLWPWVREAYRAIEPDRILFENVAGIVSHDGGRTLAERFEHLREDGYAVRWVVLGACAVGAPHHRHRWYALAEFVGGVAPEAVRVGGSKAICGAPCKVAGLLFPTPNARDGGSRGAPSVEHAARRAANPERSLNLEDAAILTPAGWGARGIAVRRWEAVTGVPAPAATEPGPKGGPRLNAAFAEWLMGLRPGLLTGQMSRSEALKAAGNGVVPQQARAAWELLTGEAA